MKRLSFLFLLCLFLLIGCDGDDNDTATDGDISDGDTADGDVEDGDTEDGDSMDGDTDDGDVGDGDVADGDITDGDVEDGDMEDGDIDLIEYDPLELTFTNPPINIGDIQADFTQDVLYGDDPLQAFDIFIPDAEEPTPLIVYIHGGGFTGGDKDNVYGSAGEIKKSLEYGVAFATINYRLLENVDHEGVIKPLTDSARCIQFMRYFADTLNIDPERIALYGGSAGAGTSLWMGFHDDMANTNSNDPVLHESTRVSAIGAIETQGTYDLVRWTTDVFGEYGITFDLVFAVEPSAAQLLNSFYGIDEFDEMYSDEIVAYRADVDMLALMTIDDPPMYVRNTSVPNSVPTDLNAFFHHPNHALVLKEQADEVGLEYIAHIPKLDIVDETNTGVITFLLQNLDAL